MEKLFELYGISAGVWDSPSDVKRIENGKKVTNEFMFELYKLFKASGKGFSVFHEVILNLVPYDIFDDFAQIKASSFRGRLDRFYKKARNSLKDASTKETFMEEYFSFTFPKKEDPDTPRKKHLKSVIREKEERNKKMKLEFEEQESRIQDLEIDLSEADSRICSLELDLSESDSFTETLEKEKFQIQRVAAGLKSGISRHPCSTPKKQDLPEVKKESKASATEIKGISGDLVFLDKEKTDGIIIGKKYFGA